MVRLLLSQEMERRGAEWLFQSHNGAIAATQLSSQSEKSLAFQSHNGAIAAQMWREI